ncbi:hypothetical protein Pfo_005148, partial [Paulownia fortunei]
LRFPSLSLSLSLSLRVPRSLFPPSLSLALALNRLSRLKISGTSTSPRHPTSAALLPPRSLVEVELQQLRTTSSTITIPYLDGKTSSYLTLFFLLFMFSIPIPIEFSFFFNNFMCSNLFIKSRYGSVVLLLDMVYFFL